MIEPTETTQAPPRVESHLEPSHAWIVGLALAEDGTVLAAPDVRPDDGAWPTPRRSAPNGRRSRRSAAPDTPQAGDRVRA